MLVTFLGHAQLLVTTVAGNLLLDPWFAEPVFARAWWRYPPPPYPSASSLPKIDALLLSHIHPDHSGPGTLATLDPATPTYMLPFPSSALERRLARAKYTRVTRTRPFERTEVLPGIYVTFVPHDRGWEVSSIVVEAEGVRLYHGNDNAISIDAYREVRARLGSIDIAFLPFAGASSFPTGFEWPSPEVLAERCQGKKQEGIRRFLDGIDGLQPGVAVPFASSWALLEPSQLAKNYVDRPTPLEAVEAARALGHDAALHLDPGDEWSKQTGRVAKRMTAGWGYDAASVERYARSRAADVTAALEGPGPVSSRALPRAGLDGAFRAYAADMFAAAGESVAKLEMVAGFVAEGEGGGRWHMVFERGEPPRLAQGASEREDETLTLTAKELWDIVAGPANWEDPWYGYRLRVRKRPGAGYYRAFWEMLLNFDDEATSARIASTAHASP